MNTSTTLGFGLRLKALQIKQHFTALLIIW